MAHIEPLLHFWTMLGFQPIQWTFLLYILNINAKSMENGDIYRIYSNETCDIDECRPQWYCCKYFHSIEQPVAWAALSWKWLVVCFDIELCKLLLVTFRLFTFCYFQLILVTFSFYLIIPLVIILFTFCCSDTAICNPEWHLWLRSEWRKKAQNVYVLESSDVLQLIISWAPVRSSNNHLNSKLI